MKVDVLIVFKGLDDCFGFKKGKYIFFGRRDCVLVLLFFFLIEIVLWRFDLVVIFMLLFVLMIILEISVVFFLFDNVFIFFVVLFVKLFLFDCNVCVLKVKGVKKWDI